MAKKKKNKTEQTFNVYPYLGGYQHFMRNGGALPKFAESGAVDPSVVAKRIKPHNKYGYANTWSGVVDEWQANNDPNYIPRGSMMGQFANLIDSSVDFGKNVIGAFDKDNYKPGGKYSKVQTKYVPGRCSDPKHTTKEDCTAAGQKWTEGGDQYDGLKYANQTITNTTGNVATMNMENLEKWNNMSKKEKKQFIEDGGRNTDLWWTPEEMAEGKWNYMDIDPATGLPRYDGINLQASTMRADALEDLTGDRMFSNKTKVKQADGTYKFVYFDKDGNLAKSQVPTEYDLIEEGTDIGQLGDANVTNLNIDFQSNEDLLNIPGVVMGPDGYPIHGETGERVIPKNKLTSFDHHVQDEDGAFKHNKNVEYDPTKNYGEYTDVERRESNLQAKNECEGKVTCPGEIGIWISDETGGRCECPTGAKYGKEIPEYLRGGGTAQEAVLCDAYDKPVDPKKAWAADTVNNYKGPGMNNDSDKVNRGLWKYGGELDKFVYGGALPKYQEAGSVICQEPEEGCPEGQSWNEESCACTNPEIDLGNTSQDPYGVNAFDNNPMSNFDVNANAEPPIMVADESENSVEHQPRVLNQYELAGIDDPTKREEKGGFTCSDGKSKTREECEANGATWNDPNDMGIDSNYGKGPLQKAWNKSREFLNTGVMGAAQDVLVGQSAEKYCKDPQYTTKEECEKNGAKWIETKGTGAVSLLYDNIMPIAHNILGQNAEHKADLHKRSVSAEDIYAASEAGVGAGQRGFYDINKGGYGDDLYGTGKIYGQTAQQGIEMPPQNQKDFSTALGYMNQENGLKFNLDLLAQQKAYLGKMNMKFGGSLPKFQETGENQMGITGHYSEEGSGITRPLPFSVDDLGNVTNKQHIGSVSNMESSHIVDSEKGINEFNSDWESMSAFTNSAGSNPYLTRKSWWDRNILGGKKHEGEEGYVKGNYGNYYDPNRKRDVKQLNKAARKAGFDNVNDYLASIDYTMGEDGIPVSNPYMAKRYSRTKDANHSGTFGRFTPPVAGEAEGKFTFTTPQGVLLRGDEARQAYWENYGQYTKDESGIYSNPENAGSFLPEVVIKGAYGGQLPKAQDGKEKPWYSKVADYTQTALSGAGLTPGPIGFVADAINTGISGTRTGYNAAIGDTEAAKIHGENLALNATSMIPGPAGWAAGGTAIAKDVANYAGVTDGDKSVTTQVADAVTDKKPPLITENMTGTKKVGTTAKYGKEMANIDMDLYYELLRAGADIKIIR